MKAFVISLSQIPASRRSSKKVLTRLKRYKFDAELFEGTYGWDATELFEQDGRRIAPWGIKGGPDKVDKDAEYVAPENAGKMMRPGVIGCFYSHYRLWQKCIELDEPIFIFEDDVIFKRGWRPVEWDEILMVCTGKKAHNHWYYQPKLDKPQSRPEAVEMRNTSMPGAVGYAIKPEGARKLVEAYCIDMLPADTAMNQYVVKIQCHSHLMGRAAIDEDGKESLTASKIWTEKS